jgi:hypothetical protein
MSETETAFDFDAVWAKYPSGAVHQRLGVLTEIHNRALPILQAFMLGVHRARGGNIFTPAKQIGPDDFTREEWRRLLMDLGVSEERVCYGLVQLGFNLR